MDNVDLQVWPVGELITLKSLAWKGAEKFGRHPAAVVLE